MKFQLVLEFEVIHPQEADFELAILKLIHERMEKVAQNAELLTGNYNIYEPADITKSQSARLTVRVI